MDNVTQRRGEDKQDGRERRRLSGCRRRRPRVPSAVLVLGALRPPARPQGARSSRSPRAGPSSAPRAPSRAHACPRAWAYCARPRAREQGWLRSTERGLSRFGPGGARVAGPCRLPSVLPGHRVRLHCLMCRMLGWAGFASCGVTVTPLPCRASGGSGAWRWNIRVLRPGKGAFHVCPH